MPTVMRATTTEGSHRRGRLRSRDTLTSRRCQKKQKEELKQFHSSFSGSFSGSFSYDPSRATVGRADEQESNA